MVARQRGAVAEQREVEVVVVVEVEPGGGAEAALRQARRQLHEATLPVSEEPRAVRGEHAEVGDRKSTRLNSSHLVISYAVFCLKKEKNRNTESVRREYDR